MTNLFKPYDAYSIETELPFDTIVSGLKRHIYIDEATFNQYFHPSVSKRYFGEFSYPNKFLIRSSTNPGMAGMNAGIVTEIDIEKKQDKCIVNFKVNNSGPKSLIVILSTAAIGFSFLGLLLFEKEFYLLMAFPFAFGLLGFALGHFFMNMALNGQIDYFESLFRKPERNIY